MPREPAASRKSTRGRRPQSKELKAAKDALVREHILEVSEGIFAEQGFANTKMQDIAREAGVSLGTLYQSYPGKQDLYRALLIARDSQMFKVATERAQRILPGLNAVEPLLWSMQAHVGFLLQHPDYLRMQLQQGYVWYHSASWPSTDEREMWEHGLSLLEQVFQWGMEQGYFVPGQPAEQSKLMMAMQQARLASWVSSGMQDSHEVVTVQILSDFVRLFCCPQVAKRLLTEDGGAMNDVTLGKIRAIEQRQ